jgi:hypothetical protein
MISYPFLRHTSEFVRDALSQTVLLTLHQGIFHRLLNEAPRWHCTTAERSDTAGNIRAAAVRKSCWQHLA